MRTFVFGAVLAAALVVPQLSSSAGEYKIDPVHSMSIFKVKHYGVSYIYGTLPEVSGTISFDPASPESSTVEIKIKTASVTTQNAGRDRHLSGPDFFNVKEFPVMTFKSSSWKKTGDGTFEVVGVLDVVGVEKTITAKVEHVGTGKHPRSGKELAGFRAEFTFDRSAFGMNYGVSPDGKGLGKEIDVIVSVESILQ